MLPHGKVFNGRSTRRGQVRVLFCAEAFSPQKYEKSIMKSSKSINKSHVNLHS